MAQQPFIFELNVNFSTTIQLPFIDVFPFDCVVDWGDGSQNAITAYNDPASAHSYSPGTYTVTITGYCGGWSVNNGAIKNYLTDIVQFGTQTYFNNGNAFYGCSLLTNITATDYPGFGGYADRLNAGFFRNCPNLVFDLSGCYMGAQSVFESMLSGDVNPSQDWDFSFASWFNLNGLRFNIDITPWKEHFLSAVPSGNWVRIGGFKGNDLFNCGDAAGVSGTKFRWFNITSPTEKRLSNFFQNCSAFNQDINTNIQNAGQPDEYVAWDVSEITQMGFLFQGASSFNQNIGDWDVSSVGNMSHMFNGATAFNNGGVGGEGVGMDTWDVSSVSTFQYTFWDADSFNQYIGSWVLRPAGVSCEAMFFNNNGFNQDIGNWTNTSSITNIAFMFAGATAFNNGGFGGVGQGLDKWDVSNKTSFIQLFSGATSFNQYLGSWNVSSVTNMSQVFQNATAYNQDLDGWERTTPDVSTLANVTSMRQMFQNDSVFNGNVSNWNVSSCENFSSMFLNCTAFDQNLGAWTLASATTCNDMFYQSGISDANLEATLYGWSLNPSTATGVSATNIALSKTYPAGSNMDLALNDPTNGLVAAKGWNITGITIV